MKILLISGHGEKSNGANSSYGKEYLLTREVTKNLKKELDNYNCEVDIYDTSKDAFVELGKGNFKLSKVYDYVLEIHFNSYNKFAYGTEIYTPYDEKYQTVENEIMKSLGKLFFVRGTKKMNFFLIDTLNNNQKTSTALLEVCFIDNRQDMTIYKNNKTKVARLICNGMVRGFGLTEKKKPSKPIKPKPHVKPIPPKPSTKPTTWKFNDNVKIRTSPDTSLKSYTGVDYKKGQTVIISEVINGNSYKWGVYYTQLKNGQLSKRYVALYDIYNQYAFAKQV